MREAKVEEAVFGGWDRERERETEQSLGTESAVRTSGVKGRIDRVAVKSLFEYPLHRIGLRP